MADITSFSLTHSAATSDHDKGLGRRGREYRGGISAPENRHRQVNVSRDLPNPKANHEWQDEEQE